MTAPPKHGALNPVLAKVRSNVETTLKPALRDPVQQVVVAGMKLLYAKQTHDEIVAPIYQQIAQGGFRPDQIATAMVNLLGTLMKAAKGGMQTAAAYPAGVILLTYVLDDLEQSYGLTVTDQLVKQIEAAMRPKFMQAFHVTEAIAAGPPPTPLAAQTPAAGPPPMPAPAGLMGG